MGWAAKQFEDEVSDMHKKGRLSKVCGYCNRDYEVGLNRRTQQYCSRECAQHSVRRYIPRRRGSAWEYCVDGGGGGPRVQREYPFRKTTEEVRVAVQEYLASGGAITVLPSPSGGSEGESGEFPGEVSLVDEIMAPHDRDRSKE